MKAQLVAAVLSLFIMILPAQASAIPEKAPLKQSAVTVAKKINLNTADVSLLTGSFKGIGKKRAEAIIAYRERNKGFKSLEELAEVKGLGQRFVTVNHDKLQEVFSLK